MVLRMSAMALSAPSLAKSLSCRAAASSAIGVPRSWANRSHSAHAAANSGVFKASGIVGSTRFAFFFFVPMTCLRSFRDTGLRHRDHRDATTGQLPRVRGDSKRYVALPVMWRSMFFSPISARPTVFCAT